MESESLPERAATGKHAGLATRRILHSRTAEEAVILDALLPKVLALVAAFEEEFHSVLVVALKYRFTLISDVLRLCNIHLRNPRGAA